MTTPTLLIVDDSAVIRHTIKKSLQKRFPHFSFHAAANGRDAQYLIEQNRIHLILCDWEMPEMCGDELLMWLRQHPAHRRIPFVMVTSRTDPEWRSQAAKLGVNDYLGKPFSLERLAEMAAVELLKFGLGEEVLQLEGAGLAHLSNSNIHGMDPLKAARASLSGALSRERLNEAQAPVSMLEHRNQHLRAAFGSEHQKSVKGLITAEIRIGDQRLRCLIEAMGSRSASVTIPGGQPAPALFEPAVFDVEIPGSRQSAHFNAFVVNQGAFEPRAGVHLQRADLIFVDDDPDKFLQLRLLGHAICAQRLGSENEDSSADKRDRRSYDFSGLSSGDSAIV